MKKYFAVADVVPEDVKSYLTPGKEYEVRNMDYYGFAITDDTGDNIWCLLEGCGFLDGNNWRIIGREEPDAAADFVSMKSETVIADNHSGIALDTQVAGGEKFDQDKVPLHLLDTYALEETAKVLAFGAKKYGANNWRKGIKKTRLLAAALRHLFAYLRGEDLDPESRLSHIAHAMCCCMFLLGLMHRTDLDDRYKDTE